MFRRLTAVRRFHGGGDLQEHLQEGQRVIHNGLRRGFCFSDLNAYEKQPCSSRFWYSSGQFACASASSRRFASRHVQEYYKAAASSHDVEPLADTDTTRDAARGVNGMVLKSHGVLGSSNLSAFRFRDALKAEAAIRNNFTKNPRSAQECFGSGSKAVNFRTTVSRTFGQRLSQFTVRVGFEERTGRHHAPRAFSTILTPSDWDCGSPEGPERVETDPAAIPELALDSVVKIFTMASSPNYFLPWQNKPQREITGSGFVISGRRIVTNAHVVADQTYVVVRKHGSPSKYRAEVRAVGHECDLALLSVHDEEFWEGMRTLQLGDIPYLQESVAVVGYPQGGDNISVTGGVVSRVEPTQYIHGTAHLMAIQIDAAINPGNSGGPALMEDKVVGVAFQNLAGAENIGYIIPVPIIKHFLEDVEERDCYVGFCSLGITCQPTENSQLREHLKMPPGLTGVLINRIEPLTDSNHWLRKDDVLLAFDGHPIANDGTVHFRNRERISFDHLVSMKRAGEKADLRIWRDGHVEYGAVTLNPLRFLTPVHQFDRLPSYFIFAGLVFTPLTQPYLHEYGDDWYNTAPRRICEKALTGSLTKPQEQVVLLSQVLVDEVNAGYERLADFQVQKVNGVEVINLKHLKELVESCAVQSLRFDLDDSRVLVLNFEKAKEASPKILSRHRIPSYASVDLLRKSSSDSKEEKDSLVENRAS